MTLLRPKGQQKNRRQRRGNPVHGVVSISLQGWYSYGMSHTAPEVPELIDTHCHLDDSRFAAPLEMILARARTGGVTRFVVPGVGQAGWGEIARIAREYSGVFSAPGLHPMRA